MKKIKLFTYTLFFISMATIANAGCGGPRFNIIRGAYFLGPITGCTNSVVYPVCSGNDTLSVIIAPTDVIVLSLSAENQCDPMDSVQWFKDGVLISTNNYSGYDFTDTVMGPGIYTCKFNYGYGASALHCIYTFYPATTTGITTLSAESTDLKVYPNPSNGIFTVDAGTDAQSYTITVSDVSGRIIKEIRGNEKTLTVDISTYAPGFYSLAYIDNSGRRKTKKLVYN